MHVPTRLKVCGVTRPEMVVLLAEAGVDAMGLNFWPGSKRHVSVDEVAGWELTWPRGLRRAGLFVNASETEIRATASFGLIDSVQLHGDETPELVVALQDLGLPLVKALALSPDGSLPEFATWIEAGVEGLLLDAHAPGIYGGTGRVIDWDLAAEFVRRSPVPVWLAGGLKPENLAEAIKRVAPAWVDVASGAESLPGIQRPELVQALVAARRQL